MSSRTVEILSAKGSITLECDEGEPEKLGFRHAPVNTGNGVILKQLRYNLKRPLPQLRMSPPREEELLIIGGGPSINGLVDEIKERIADGAKTMVLNGAHDWAAENGITRHFAVTLDMQPTTTRFYQKPHKDVVYLISSACNPRVFDLLEGHKVYMFHCSGMASRATTLDRYYFGRVRPAMIEGSGTVGSRAPLLAWMIGFRKMHLYGFDSCILDTRHHAYPQDLNDDNSIELVRVGDREFLCQGWMVDQVWGFLQVLKYRGKLFQLQIHGDGLLAYVLEFFANQAENDRAAA
jgi:hypothetical protein